MPTPRFLTLDDVAEILNVSWSQAYALVRRKELIAIQIGGRGQWRGGEEELGGFLQQKKAQARGAARAAQTPPGDAPGGVPRRAEPGRAPAARRPPQTPAGPPRAHGA